MTTTDTELERYSRQMRFAGLGAEGQRRLLASRVTVCGCGALGTVIANGLARAGVGFLRVVDRDFIELNNLQRQLLFDEADIAANLPKAEAAVRKLRRINSAIEIEAVVTDIDHTNIHALCHDADLLLDGTDNFETRFLLNDYACKTGKPWVFGGCIGSEGQCMTILPGRTPCLRCFLESAPPAGTAPTCETAGILSSISTIIASFQVAEAIKILSGHAEHINDGFLVIDIWENTLRRLRLEGLKEQADCPVCKHGRYDWLEGAAGTHTTRLCGRNAVQVVPPNRQAINLDSLRQRVEPYASVSGSKFMLRFTADGYEFSVFPDGRAIIKGTDDLAAARSLYSRYIGS